MGLENMFWMTQQINYTLRISMVSADKTKRAQENYLHFEIKENVRALSILAFYIVTLSLAKHFKARIFLYY